MNSTPFTADQIAQMNRQRAGTFVDERGCQPMLAGYAVVDSRLDYPDLGWIVVAQQPYATALAPVRDSGLDDFRHRHRRGACWRSCWRC